MSNVNDVPATPAPLLSLRDIRKKFLGTEVLKGIDVSLSAGEVVSLVGMNGAGKSTLSNIIAGVHIPDSGEILVNGVRADIQSPKDAEQLKIGIVSQEPTLCENLTVAENIFLNNESIAYGVLLSRAEMRARSVAILRVLGYNIDPDAVVEDLPLVSKGVVAIAKAMLLQPRILILDEVTAPLSGHEVERLFSVVRELRGTGIAIVFISHKLQEVVEISDRVIVMRDGLLVGEFKHSPGGRIDERDIIHEMLGETEGWHSEYREREAVERSEDILLSARNLTKEGAYEDVSLDLHKREIVGIAGLKGAGITELLFSLFGALATDGGEIRRDRRPVKFSSPRGARAAGVGMITNDRQREGLALMLSVEENMTISSLEKFSSPLGFLSPTALASVVRQFIGAMGLKTTGPSQPVQYLSGGNQQKVVVAKWLLRDCDVILVDEPTRGVDVKAKNQIYDLLSEQKMANKAILVHSPEVRELLNLCDRILVMSRGKVVAEGVRGDALFTERGLLAAIHAGDADRQSTRSPEVAV